MNASGINDPGYNLSSQARVFVESAKEIEVFLDIASKVIFDLSNAITLNDSSTARTRSQGARAAISLRQILMLARHENAKNR